METKTTRSQGTGQAETPVLSPSCVKEPLKRELSFAHNRVLSQNLRSVLPLSIIRASDAVQEARKHSHTLKFLVDQIWVIFVFFPGAS